MIGVKTQVTLERTLYLDLPENSSDEEVIKAAKEEIILPTNALIIAAQALHRFNINIPKLDLKDWSVSSTNYEVLND